MTLGVVRKRPSTQGATDASSSDIRMEDCHAKASEISGVVMVGGSAQNCKGIQLSELDMVYVKDSDVSNCTVARSGLYDSSFHESVVAKNNITGNCSITRSRLPMRKTAGLGKAFPLEISRKIIQEIAKTDCKAHDIMDAFQGDYEMHSEVLDAYGGLVFFKFKESEEDELKDKQETTTYSKTAKYIQRFRYDSL